MKILVTGGAGYIGSFMIRRLLSDGHDVVVIDSLERGRINAISEKVTFEKGNLTDKKFLDDVFTRHDIEGVFHFAAYISVPESVKEPGKYYENNLIATINLLNVMHEHACNTFIFSSTAAVYGTPRVSPIPEDHEKNPESPYGQTKLMIEHMLPYYHTAYGMNFTVLRYFNASGAALDGSHGEAHHPETHMIPCAIQAILNKKTFTLYGTDYETPDGTCVRDYIHVLDLVEAHVLAFARLQKENGGFIYNVGTGSGFSNRQVVEEIKKVSGKEVEVIEAERRPGDPSILVANATKIREELGFEPKYSDLTTIVSSAWKWHSSQFREEA